MFSKGISLSRNVIYLLVYARKQLFSLMRLFFSLLTKDSKSAFSILFFSTESLVSVIRYTNRGRQALDLKRQRDKIVNSKKSLFILGSGPSVNTYSESEWDIIRRNHSWGFNLWFCHDFVPSVYFAQSLIEPDKDNVSSREYNTNMTLSKMLLDKKDVYGQTEFLLRGDAVNKGKFFNNEFGQLVGTILGRNASFIAEMPISSENKIAPEILYESIFEAGFFSVSEAIQVVPKFGSTITEMIALALILGYKEIILCGIDMNNGGHFYDNEESFQRYPYLRELSSINHNRTSEGVHEHMDASVRPFTIKQYIVALKNFAEKRFNAKIFVMNEVSTLFPEIEKYDGIS